MQHLTQEGAQKYFKYKKLGGLQPFEIVSIQCRQLLPHPAIKPLKIISITVLELQQISIIASKIKFFS